VLYIGGEGGAGGDSVFDLELRSYRFESITWLGQTEEWTYTPTRIETIFHKYTAHFKFPAPLFEMGFFLSVRSRETGGL